MSLLALYDELLGDPVALLTVQRDEIGNRAALLRAQLAARLVDGLALDEHSFALPAMASYLGSAIRLYLLGFYDAAIIEAEARLAAVCGGRLDGMATPAHPPAPLAALVARAEAAGLFSAAALGRADRQRLCASLQELSDKRQAIAARNRDQGLQITVVAPAAGALSGGPGAAHTEPILGYYLSWGANLHHLLADGVLAVTLILAGGSAPGASPDLG
jgi:hypothetical protein